MSSAPPTYSASPAPPAGLRVPLTTSLPPRPDTLGPAPFADLGGEPVYVASALIGKSVQPCKVCYFPGAGVGVRVPFGGQELVHSGRYDVLPITDQMEWVTTSGGQVSARLPDCISETLRKPVANWLLPLRRFPRAAARSKECATHHTIASDYPQLCADPSRYYHRFSRASKKVASTSSTLCAYTRASSACRARRASTWGEQPTPSAEPSTASRAPTTSSAGVEQITLSLWYLNAAGRPRC